MANILGYAAVRVAAGDEVILLDGNAEAAGKVYWDLGAATHSPDHTLVAYSTDDKGSELYTVRDPRSGDGIEPR